MSIWAARAGTVMVTNTTHTIKSNLIGRADSRFSEMLSDLEKTEHAASCDEQKVRFSTTFQGEDREQLLNSLLPLCMDNKEEEIDVLTRTVALLFLAAKDEPKAPFGDDDLISTGHSSSVSLLLVLFGRILDHVFNRTSAKFASEMILLMIQTCAQPAMEVVLPQFLPFLMRLLKFLSGT